MKTIDVVTKYMTICCSNWNRKPNLSVMHTITDELSRFSHTAIENGFQNLIREEERFPVISTILKYVKQQQNNINQQDDRALPQPALTENDRHMTHLFLQLLAENMQNSATMEYDELLDVIGKRAVRDGLDVDYVGNKIGKLMKIFQKDAEKDEDAKKAV